MNIKGELHSLQGRISIPMKLYYITIKQEIQCRIEFEGKLEVLFGMEMGQVYYWPEDVK